MIEREAEIFEPLFLIASFTLCFLLYLPAIHGGPIWDDLYYWFNNSEMKLSLWEIWRYFSWPFSVSAQKIILENWGENYIYYHLLNIGLHLTNSFLVYGLAKKLHWPKPRWIFLLFLLHPANVISVAWMIQFKTLLCFLFAILSFLFFEKGLRNPRWMPAAVILFILSLLSKSAAITLPVLFFIYSYQKISFRKRLWYIPLFVVSLAAAVTLLNRNPPPSAAPSAKKAPIDFALLAQTTKYYFWHSLMPLENAPVKGHAPRAIQPVNLTHVVFAAAVLVFFWRTTLVWYLFSGYILLLPFVGLVFAPYMNVTWVSDQHLYLALPLLLAFWVMLFERLSSRISTVLCTILLGLFIYKTAETTPYFANEDTFYRESLKADPGNVIIAFNYASILAYQDKTERALEIAEATHAWAQRFPEIKLDKHYDEIEGLREKLIEFEAFKKQKKQEGLKED